MTDLLHRECKFTVDTLEKADTERGVFTGYANVTGYVDSGGDNVVRGAFARTVKLNKGKFPLFAFHDPTTMLGYVEVGEDEKGLKVNRGVINLNTETGRDFYEHMRLLNDAGLKMEMSIGYIPDPKKIDWIDGVRHIKELKLKEVSLLPPGYAMNDRSRVRTVKALRDMIRDALDEDDPPDKHDTTSDQPASAGFFDAQISELEAKLENIQEKLAALLPEDSASETADDSLDQHSEAEPEEVKDCDPHEHSQKEAPEEELGSLHEQINQLITQLQEKRNV